MSFELIVSEVQPQEISIKNKEELKKELAANLEKYNKVLTEETVKEGSSDRAKLNKLIDAIETKRKEIKNSCLEPYNNIEKDFKELTSLIGSVRDNLDKQIKSFEQKKKDEKLEFIVKYFSEKVSIYQGLIDFDLIFNERWLNVTYELEKVYQDIDHIFAKTNNDLLTINAMVKDEKLNEQVTDYYFKHINLPTCLGDSLKEADRIQKINEQMKHLKEPKAIITEKKEDPNKVICKTIQQEVDDIETEKQYEFSVLLTDSKKVLLRTFLKENKIPYGFPGDDLKKKYRNEVNA